MKLTSYKELLERLIKQIKESEVTDERIIRLVDHIQNDILDTDYYKSKKPLSYEEFANLNQHKDFTRTATWCAYLAEAYEKYKNTFI